MKCTVSGAMAPAKVCSTHSPGMVDIEFVVQYLVLAHASQHPALLDNAGNIALLARAGDAGLIDAQLALEVANAYRRYRQIQHKLRLNDAQFARVEAGEVDLAIGPQTTREFPDLVMLPCFQLARSVITRAGHPLLLATGKHAGGGVLALLQPREHPVHVGDRPAPRRATPRPRGHRSGQRRP